MSKTLGLVIASPFADWEAAPLAALAREWFGLTIVWIAEAPTVSSIGGMSVTRDRGIEIENNGDLDAIALIGSTAWENGGSQELIALLQTVHQRGGVVAGICGGTVPLAHSGLFSGRAHTSNNGEWLLSLAPDYPGHDLYRDSPFAIADGTVVTSSALAPVTFATAVLTALLPEQAAAISTATSVFSLEHAPR